MCSMFRFLTVVLFCLLISCTSDSETTEEPDIIAPVIGFSISGTESNSEGEPIVVSNTLEINIDAQDAGGIGKIEGFINNEKVGEDTNAPYRIIVDIKSYASKIGKTNVYKNYTLKVTATDLSGNATSIEQAIHIDNDMPSISEVSILDNSIINGKVNQITFSVSDNQEVAEVTTFLNDELLSKITDGIYDINIDTTVLLDGANSFKIVAKDAAGNTSNYVVEFISDNTGPVITLPSLEANQIIDEGTMIAPSITDEFSEIIYSEILFDNQSLADISSADLVHEFNPELHSAGVKEFTFLAIDNLGNRTELSLPVDIRRILIKVNIPNEYRISNNSKFWIFASDEDGTTIDIKEALSGSTIKLNSLGEFSDTDQFMLTFIEISGSVNSNQVNDVFTVYNLTKSLPGIINLQPSKEFSGYDATEYGLVGFDYCINLEGAGLDYYTGRNNDTSANVYTRNPLYDPQAATDEIYLTAFNICRNEFSYKILDKPIPAEMELNLTDFVTDRVSNGLMEFSELGLMEMTIHGFKTKEKYNTNSSNLLFRTTYNTEFSAPQIPYFWISGFSDYRHSITINSYTTERKGLPLANYEIPNWTVDHQLSNKLVAISTSGTGHTVGKMMVNSISKRNSNYLNWLLVFDSQQTSSLVLPELPEILSPNQLSATFKDNDLEIYQTQVTGYEGISNYDAYLNLVIKENKKYYDISDKTEAKYKFRETGDPNVTNRPFIVGDYFLYRN